MGVGWAGRVGVAVAAAGLVGCWAGVAPAGAAAPRRTVLISVSRTGTVGNSSSGGPSVSADGRYVAFWSEAGDLVPGDTNHRGDVFVRDVLTGRTRLVSVSSTGAQGNADSYNPAISADGRYIAFESIASNLVPRDSNEDPDIFVRDVLTGQTRLVSRSSTGTESNDISEGPSISADGRFVAFVSYASNLVPGDSKYTQDVFVRNLLRGRTVLVSRSSTGVQGNNVSYGPSLSADGRYVAFASYASNLLPGDTNNSFDVFVRDLRRGGTRLVSNSSTGAPSTDNSEDPSISADGRYVAFDSYASNLVPGDTNDSSDVFVRDLRRGGPRLVSRSSTGAFGNGTSDYPSISADGRSVAFGSAAGNLVPHDVNGKQDLFVRDVLRGRTRLVSRSSTGAPGNSLSFNASISADGRYVAFQSFAGNLVPGDTNNTVDVFLRDLLR